jgi:hypothetical protein
VTQPERRPQARGELDLTKIEGRPTAAADQAYAFQGSGITIDGAASRLPLGGSFKIRLKAAERSQLTTMVTCAIAVVMGIAAGFGARGIGLDPLPAVLSGGLVWISSSLLVVLRHRRS